MPMLSISANSFSAMVSLSGDKQRAYMNRKTSCCDIMLDTMTNCRMRESWLEMVWEIIQDCIIRCYLFQFVPVDEQR